MKLPSFLPGENNNNSTNGNKKFQNPFNRERHERQIHLKQSVVSTSSGSTARSASETQQPAPSPAMTRNRKKTKTGRKSIGPIFDYERNPVARRLRDKAIEEHAKWVERQAESKAKVVEERRLAIESRKKALEEKNRLATENERLREEREHEKRDRSERAIANLIESRKRRR